MELFEFLNNKEVIDLKDALSVYPLKTPKDVFGMYVHIPYCLQKCHYCDFVKFKVDELPPFEDYFNLLLRELKQKKIPEHYKVKSLYFGGGTPSLAPKKLLEKFIKEVFSIYTKVSNDIEITLEINPKTLDKSDIQDLLNIGFNRFSLGVQSFQDKFLNSCGRDHSGKDSIKDLENFSSLGLNFSADILFGLPGQRISDLKEDLKILSSFNPPHVSPYNLTLPDQHSFNKNRATNEEQAEMMSLITKTLLENDIRRYEVSNYSKPGFESKHNIIYWTDTDYWGLGMGAHSYFKYHSKWGRRAWNQGVYKKYEESLSSLNQSSKQFEDLKEHEALTDFCHTSLRSIIGLDEPSLSEKFSSKPLPKSLWDNLKRLVDKELLTYDNRTWRLTDKGFKIPNQVFEELCFLEADWD